MKREEIIKECKDNDVKIKFIIENDKIDEIQVTVNESIDGWTVIGFSDLMSAISDIENTIKYNKTQ